MTFRKLENNIKTLYKSNSISRWLLLAIVMLGSCSEKQEAVAIKQEDSLRTIQQEQADRKRLEAQYAGKYPKIGYKLMIPANQKEFRALLSKNKNKGDTANPYKILTTLNRKELRYFRPEQKIIVPDTLINDTKAYSIFPQYYWGARKLPKLIVVSNKYQAYACYENGLLIRYAATNTGKETTPTYPGRYALVWKEKKHRSSLDSNWVMPFNYNFHPQAGNAFHQFEMPGRPVSHSCCRQFMDDAEWLFYWGKGADRDKRGKFVPYSGTPVLMLGIFDFSRKRGGPWLDLKSTKDSLIVLPEDPMAVEEALIPICQIPVDSRGSLRNISRYRSAEDTLRAKGIIRAHVKLIETKNYNQVRREKELKLYKAKIKKQGAETPDPMPNNPNGNGSSYQKEMEKKEKQAGNPAPVTKQVNKNVAPKKHKR